MSIKLKETLSETLDDDADLPEKLRGKTRKEIAAIYQEAERHMHEKSAESAKYKAMLDMSDVQNQRVEMKENSGGAPKEKPDEGSSVITKDSLIIAARAAYNAAIQDSLTMYDLREGLKQYLDQHSHLKKANRLFQSAVAQAMAAAKSDPSKTLLDVLDEARTMVEESITEAGGSFNKAPSRGRLLEGGGGVESRNASKKAAKEAEDSDDDSFDSYLRMRQGRGRTSSL